MKTVKELTEHGYEFDASAYFSEGRQLLSKHLGPLIGMTFLFILIGFFVSSIPYLSLVSNLIGVILFSGFFIFLANSKKGTDDAKDFFGGFQFTKDIILQRLVFLLFFVPFVLLIFLLGFPIEEIIEVFNQTMTPEEFGQVIAGKMVQNGAIIFLAFLVLLIGSFYLYISYIFAIPLIVVGKLNFWAAMETSRKVVSKRFLSYFGSVFILMILITLMIMLTCGIGILFAIPLLNCIIYAAFEAIFKPTDSAEKTTLDEFGSSSDDYNSESQFR